MSQIAARYANALYSKVDERGAAKVMHDLERIQKWDQEFSVFHDFIYNPLITREDAAKALKALAEKAKFHRVTKDFLIMVARKRRLSLLPQIISETFHLYDHHKGIVKAIITSAQKLGAPQLKNIQRLLKAKFNKTLKTDEVLDPGVLGGFKVRVGTYLIDATLKTQLMQIQQLLKEA